MKTNQDRDDTVVTREEAPLAPPPGMEGLSVPDPTPRRGPTLTVISTVSHQCPDEQPTSVDRRAQKTLSEVEAPFKRPRLKVGVDWQPLDTAWVKDPSLIVIHNDGDEALELAVRRDLGLVQMPFAFVSAGLPLAFEPALDVVYLIRSAGAGGVCTLTAFPN